MDMRQAFEAIEEAPLYQALVRQFELMDIADPIVTEYEQAYPEKSNEISAVFAVCQWPAFLPATAPTSLYEEHVRQLCELALAGEDLDRPTWLEVAVMTCEVSQETAINTEALQWLKGKWSGVFNAFGIADDGVPAYDAGHGEYYWKDFLTAWRKADRGSRKSRYQEALERQRRLE